MTSDAGVMLLPATDHKLGLDDDAATLYDSVYRQRGAAEHRIQEAQIGLFATRTICQVPASSPLRVLLAALAYVLVERC